MFHWIPYAFIRIVVFFIAGILLAIYFPGSISLPFAVAGFISLTILFLVLFVVNRKFHKHVINPGFIGLSAILLAGYSNLTLKTAKEDPDHLIHHRDHVAYYELMISSYPTEKTRHWRTEGEILRIKTGGEWKNAPANVMLYFDKRDFEQPFQYGDILLIKGVPQQVPPKGNPGEFDYKQYLSYKNIHHQHFIKKDSVRFLYSDPPQVILHFAFRARQWASSTLDQYVKGSREQAVASALVLGVTDDLDNELLKAYAATGAMHVLAVSGLHISIIYLIIVWLFRPLKNVRGGKWIIAILSLLILWGYAFVTGLSPSVLRAVTMFTFVVLAVPLQQRTNIYNTLAASAFLLLLYDPYLILSVGFQLSYLAVLGIVYLHPKLYALWEPNARLTDEIWKITSVSIAAQVATLPLGFLYFHQFPNYFLLTNLVVIPVSFIILIAGLLLLAVSFINFLGYLVGFILIWSIKIINGVVFALGSLPFSTIDNIFITPLQSILLFVMFIALILLVEHKNIKYLYGAFLIAMIFSLLQWTDFHTLTHQRTLTVYKVPGHTAIDMEENGKIYFLSDSLLAGNEEKISRYVHPNRLMRRNPLVVKDEGPVSCAIEGGRWMVWNDKVLLNITGKTFRIPGKVSVDYLIISNNAIYDLAEIIAHTEPGVLILDSSNHYTYAAKVKKTFSSPSFTVHAVPIEGAYQITI